jgi:hypothetical protein
VDQSFFVEVLITALLAAWQFQLKHKKKNPFKNRMAHNRQKGGSWLSATP